MREGQLEDLIVGYLRPVDHLLDHVGIDAERQHRGDYLHLEAYRLGQRLQLLEHRRYLLLVVGHLHNLRDQNQHGLGVDHGLSVVALLEAPSGNRHDPRFFVGEVDLVLGCLGAGFFLGEGEPLWLDVELDENGNIVSRDIEAQCHSVFKNVRTVLEDAGFQVMTAENGNQALEKLKEKIPDFISLDLIMPGQSGMETLGRLLSIDPDAFVVIVSSLGTEEAVHECLTTGARSFLQKPFTKDELLGAINNQIN